MLCGYRFVVVSVRCDVIVLLMVYGYVVGCVIMVVVVFVCSVVVFVISGVGF